MAHKYLRGKNISASRFHGLVYYLCMTENIPEAPSPISQTF